MASQAYNSSKLQDYAKALQEATGETFQPNESSTSNMMKTGTTLPHYEVPNLSSMLYEFTNREQERVHNTFRVGNFQSLRDLPNDILAGSILNAQKDKIEHNLYVPVEQKSYVELFGGGGYFSKFEWKEDPYELFQEKERREHQSEREKRVTIHQKPFYGDVAKTTHHKHQSAFKSSSLWETAEAFMGEDDPYEASKFEILRAKWIHESKILFGEFKPANSLKSLRKPTRALLPEMVSEIKRNLLADWSDINFVIGTNPDDMIEMRFELGTLDSPMGLLAYLNNLVNSSDIMLKYQLKRVPQAWGLPDEQSRFIYYMLQPSWVKITVPTIYLKQIQQ